MTKKIIIAIDGYSSTGKSTLAKMLSNHLNYKHINTGSMYRGVTLFAIRNQWISCVNNELIIQEEKIIDSIDNLNLEFVCDQNGVCKMYMDNEDISAENNIGWVIKHSDLLNVFFLEIDNHSNIFFKSPQNLLQVKFIFDYTFI